MIGVHEWINTYLSTTTILRRGSGDGYREGDAWFEPIPTTKTKKLGFTGHDAVSAETDLDVHDEHSVFEKIERDGQVFYLCRAIVFNAMDYHIERGVVDEWARSHKMNTVSHYGAVETFVFVGVQKN